MAKKKSKSFGKHIYALVAIVVLLVAAGIASYAGTVPSGSPTHGDLYVNTIFGKGRAFVDVNDTLKANRGININIAGMEARIGTGIGAFIVASEPSGYRGGLLSDAYSSGVVGVSPTGNIGLLGTATAGVEGTSGITVGVKGTGQSIGVLGEANSDFGIGVKGSATGNNGNGVVGTATTKYAGYFTGGRGLYASKIEFGAAAFDVGSNGVLILGATGTTACTDICAAHGQICSTSFDKSGTLVGCPSPGVASFRYCWCA